MNAETWMAMAVFALLLWPVFRVARGSMSVRAAYLHVDVVMYGSMVLFTLIHLITGRPAYALVDVLVLTGCHLYRRRHPAPKEETSL